jgi:hypothetical protein
LFWDNTNAYLGIGTSSPASTLDVRGASPEIKLVATTGTNGVGYTVNNTGGNFYFGRDSNSGGYFGSGSAYSAVLWSAGAYPMVFATNNTERIRATAAGLVGVGITTPTSMLQTAGSTSVSAFKTPNIAEVDTISATAATGTINFDITTQSVLYYTSNASANWTVNFRGSSGTSLNTLMQTGESISATFLVTQGSTAYYNSAVTIDGTSVTPKWQGGTAPTSGNASSVDCYTYVIQKTGSATYVVLASQTKFA